VNGVPMGDVAGRIAARALAKRGATYADEVRRLLDAGRETMRRCGTDTRPRVADIVAEAGLSNDAFYRHFRSKDALVAAILEDGTERLHRYVAARMDGVPEPRDKVRRWVAAVLSQAAGDVALTTRAVLWNAGSVSEVLGPAHLTPARRLAGLLAAQFAALGSADPGSDAALAAHATFGTLSDHLWRRTEPSRVDIDRVTAFCLRTLQRD
jgi:AcrR family transcriptional regulator